MVAYACDPRKLRQKDHREFKVSLLMIPGQCKLEHRDSRKEKGSGYQRDLIQKYILASSVILLSLLCTPYTSLI